MENPDSISASIDVSLHSDLCNLLLALGDDALVLGHRLSEWCGHAPQLEEDIALANIALDEIGRANVLLMYAGELEGNGRDQNDLAYFRDAVDYRNALLVEQPNVDFGYTITRQFLFDSAAILIFEVLSESTNPFLSGIAKKAGKEIAYHLRHSGRWVVRLGDGTEESHTRIQRAVDDLWTFSHELLSFPNGIDKLIEAGLVPARISSLHEEWLGTVSGTLEEATLAVPPEQFMRRGGRTGQHSEHLGYILAEMQILARSHPTASW